MATYSLKLSTENCGKTAADGGIITIDGDAENARNENTRHENGEPYCMA